MSLINRVITFLTTQKDDTTVVDDTTILNFEGDVSVVNEGDGKATIFIGGDANALLCVRELICFDFKIPSDAICASQDVCIKENVCIDICTGGTWIVRPMDIFSC